MLILANLLLLPVGTLLVLMAARARPVKPESFMGFHLVTIPLALAMTLALGLGFAAAGAPLPEWLPGWLPWLSLPGYLVALVVLPFACCERKGARFAKTAVFAAVFGAAGVVDGHLLAPFAAWLGHTLVAAVALGAYGMLGTWWVMAQRRRAAAIAADRDSTDSWRAGQAKWQREQWQQVPADAELWRLLQFTRAFDDEVKAQSLARIAALPDLDAATSALLGGEQASEALYFVAHQYPRSRAPLAPALAALLDRECARWEKKLRGPADARSWQGNVANFLESGVAVLKAGGDVVAPLRRWHRMLASVPDYAGVARELDRYLREVK